MNKIWPESSINQTVVLQRYKSEKLMSMLGITLLGDRLLDVILTSEIIEYGQSKDISVALCELAKNELNYLLPIVHSHLFQEPQSSEFGDPRLLLKQISEIIEKASVSPMSNTRLLLSAVLVSRIRPKNNIYSQEGEKL